MEGVDDPSAWYHSTHEQYNQGNKTNIERRDRALRNRQHFQHDRDRMQHTRYYTTAATSSPPPAVVTPREGNSHGRVAASSRFEPADRGMVSDSEEVSVASSWDDAETEWANVSTGSAGAVAETKATKTATASNTFIPRTPSVNHHHGHSPKDDCDTDGEDSLLMTDHEGENTDDEEDEEEEVELPSSSRHNKYKYELEDPSSQKLIRSRGGKNKRMAQQQHPQAYPTSAIRRTTSYGTADDQSSYTDPADEYVEENGKQASRIRSTRRESFGSAATGESDVSSVEDERTTGRNKKSEQRSSSRSTPSKKHPPRSSSKVIDIRKVKFHETSGGVLRNTIHEYEGEGESVASRSLYSEKHHSDVQSVGSSSVYTKSYESEVEDALKDFFLVGKAKKTTPGRRAWRDHPAMKYNPGWKAGRLKGNVSGKGKGMEDEEQDGTVSGV